MADLAQFGGGADQRPPKVRREYVIQSEVTGRLCGFLGKDLHREREVYTTRRSDFHFYREGGGYAISDHILARVEESDASRIVIHEDDEGDVYVFDARDYIDPSRGVAEEVYPDDLWREDDPQTYVELGEELHHYPDHAEYLFYQSFGEAVERINWRGYDADLKEALAEDE